MTQRKSNSSLDELNALPSPKSPAGLDARILEKARAAAPTASEKTSLLDWNGPWLRGLATTGVLVVAILIAVPGLRDDQAPSREELRTDYDSASYDHSDDDPGNLAKKGAAAERSDKLARDSAIARVNYPKQVIPDPATQRARQSYDSSMGYSMPSPKRSLNEVIVTASKATRAAPEAELMADSAIAAAESKAKPTAMIPLDTLREGLSKCAQLPDAKDKQAKDKQANANNQTAQSCYEALKKRCSACELPATLQAARKILTPQQHKQTAD